MVEGFHARGVEQEGPEQTLSTSWIGSGMVGVEEVDDDESTKLPAVDCAETFVVATESRAWTRQYQVPLARFTDQLVPDIHPDE